MSIKFEQARQARILNLLMQTQKPLTSQYFASYFNISQRLIRYDIQILKKKIASYPCSIVSIRGSGYVIKGNVEALKKEMKSELGELYYYDYIDTKDKFIREQLIIRYLILKNTIVTTKELTEHFYITRSTLKEDITRTSETIEPYHMKIHFIPYKGVYLEGTETNKRMLLTRETAFYKESPLLGFIQKQMSYIHFPFDDMIDFVHENFNISLSNVEAYNLYVHIWVMFYRINQKNYIEKEHLYYEMLSKKHIEVAKIFMNRYIPWLNPPNEEIIYLALLFLSSGCYYDDVFLDDAKKMIDEIYKQTHIQLPSEFAYDLTSILYNLIVKSKNQISSNPVMIREIKKKSPLSIDIAYKLSLLISRYYNIELFDNDICMIAYLVYHYLFESYVYKNKTVVISTSIGYLLSKKLILQLKKEYTHIHFIFLELYELESFDFENCILLISDTFVEAKPEHVSFIKIQLMYTQHDLQKISNFFQSYNKLTTSHILNNMKPIRVESVNSFLRKIHDEYHMNYEQLLEREIKITFETNKKCVVICDYNNSHTPSCGWYDEHGIYWKNANIHYFFYINLFNDQPFHYKDIENYLYQIAE